MHGGTALNCSREGFENPTTAAYTEKLVNAQTLPNQISHLNSLSCVVTSAAVPHIASALLNTREDPGVICLKYYSIRIRVMKKTVGWNKRTKIGDRSIHRYNDTIPEYQHVRFLKYSNKVYAFNIRVPLYVFRYMFVFHVHCS